MSLVCVHRLHQRTDEPCVLLQQLAAEEAMSPSSSGYSPRSEASTWEASTPRTPWQEEAALQVGSCSVHLLMGLACLAKCASSVPTICAVQPSCLGHPAASSLLLSPMHSPEC